MFSPIFFKAVGHDALPGNLDPERLNQGVPRAVEADVDYDGDDQVNTPLSPLDILEHPSNVERGVGEPTMKIRINKRNGL
jgi:hypothetical protein